MSRSPRLASTSLTVALAASLAFAPACGKKGPDTETPPAPAAVDPLDLIPADAAGVFAVDVTRLVASKAWKAASPMFLRGELADVVNKAKDKCQIDLLADVHLAVVGIPSSGRDDDFVFVLRGAFDEAKVTACVTTLAAEEKVTITSRRDGKLAVYTDGDESAYVGWADGNTVVLELKALQGDPSNLLGLLSGQSPLKNNAALMELLAKVDRSQGAWGAAALPESMRDGDASLPLAAWGHGTHVDDLRATISVKMASADAASSMVSMVQGQLGMVPPAFTAGLKLEAQGDTVVITLAYDAAQTDAMLDLAKQMLGAMM